MLASLEWILSPGAVKWRAEGFEIEIGDQGSPEFWAAFKKKYGTIDILLDDGGHTNLQQVVTVASMIDCIRDGGLILVEDVYTSYMAIFGNPSRYSFANFCKAMADTINSRGPYLSAHGGRYCSSIYSASFFTGMVAFHVDRSKCGSSEVISAGEETGATDARVMETIGPTERIARGTLDSLIKAPSLRRLGAAFFARLRQSKSRRRAARERGALRGYFREL